MKDEFFIVEKNGHWEIHIEHPCVDCGKIHKRTFNGRYYPTREEAHKDVEIILTRRMKNEHHPSH